MCGGTKAQSLTARWRTILALGLVLAGLTVGTAKAELAAELTAFPDPVVAGGQVQYVLTAVNTSGASEYVRLSAQVPEHMTVPVSGISGGGGCGTGVTVCEAGQTILWSTSNFIQQGQARTVQFTALVDAVDAPAEGTVLRASAEIGLVAEEVAQVFPELVELDSESGEVEAVNYAAMVAVLIEAYKEQEARIVQLEAQLSTVGGARDSRRTADPSGRGIDLHSD